MTNKIKKILIVTGLIACLVITILANTEASHEEHETTYNANPPSGTARVLISIGTKRIIQTTYKLLKPIQ